MGSFFSSHAYAATVPSSEDDSVVMRSHSLASWKNILDAHRDSNHLDVANEFKVEAMPTFVFFKEGKEVDRVVGAKPDQVENKIQKHLST